MKRNYEIAVVSRGGFARTVRIFGGKNAKYAVIVLDGAALFEQGYKYLYQQCKKSRTAIVGIDGTGSFDEFLPFKCENAEITPKDAGGGAEALSEYVLETLFPYLKKRFSIERFYLLGHSLSAAAVLYIAGKSNESIAAFGFIDPPLFLSPVAFDDFLKHTEFRKAGYYIACTPNPKVPEGMPQKVYNVSAVSIVAALVNSGVSFIEFKSPTDALNLSEYVLNFINSYDEACLWD